MKEEELWPTGGSALCSPCGLSASRKTVNEYNAGIKLVLGSKKRLNRLSLNHCIDLGRIQHSRAQGWDRRKLLSLTSTIAGTLNSIPALLMP